MATNSGTALVEHTMQEVVAVAAQLPLSRLQELVKLVNHIHVGLILVRVSWAQHSSQKLD